MDIRDAIGRKRNFHVAQGRFSERCGHSATINEHFALSPISGCKTNNRLLNRGAGSYSRPGVLLASPARRNASAMTSALAGAVLFRPAAVLAVWGVLSDPAEAE
jgi:hypothetical protein